MLYHVHHTILSRNTISFTKNTTDRQTTNDKRQMGRYDIMFATASHTLVGRDSHDDVAVDRPQHTFHRNMRRRASGSLLVAWNALSPDDETHPGFSSVKVIFADQRKKEQSAARRGRI